MKNGGLYGGVACDPGPIPWRQFVFCWLVQCVLAVTGIVQENVRNKAKNVEKR